MEKSTFEDLSEYIRENFGDEDEDPSACWNGARYFRFLFGQDPNIDANNAYPDKLEDINEILDWNGVYHILQENSQEVHYFTLVIEAEDLWLLQTYGGIDCLTKKKFGKNIWVEKYQKAVLN
jgi:hypothetical protein